MPHKKKGAAGPGGKSKKRPPTTDLLEQYSPYRVANILATSTKKKVDTFESCIPTAGVCLDYHVSQTFLRMDAGNTKINIKDTVATYVPVPPEMLEKKKPKARSSKFSRGGPPVWIFAQEIWLQKQNELQEIYRKELIEFIKRRKRNDRLQGRVNFYSNTVLQQCFNNCCYGNLLSEFTGREIHSRVQSLVGPEWFQELSPNQIQTANELGSCILKDMKDGTLINTQENIASLGLVLRPNHRHIAIALLLCCKCPVEFLLILYQLINPNRINYSLNDRLLLSAVVHLTMKDTLREMHVRIPSPPKPEKVPVKPPKKPKEQTYISPYLKPYTFQPEPRKFTGIYENKHIQLPESPYFDYRCSLELERDIADDVLELDDSNFEAEEKELIEDWRQAQMIYDALQQDKKVKLIKPTIAINCSDFEAYCNEMLAKLENRAAEEEGNGDNKKRASVSSKQGSTGKGGRRRSKRGESLTEEPEKLILPPLCKFEDDEAEGKCDCHPDSGICREHHSLKPCKECEKRNTSVACNCKERAELLKKYKKRTRKIMGGVVMTKSNTAVPLISGIYPPQTCDWVDTLAEAQKKCGYCQAIMNTIICSEHQSLQPCVDCWRYSGVCTCEGRSWLLKEYRKHTNTIMGGIALTKGNVRIPIITGISPPSSGDWLQALEDIEATCRYCERIKDLEKCCEHQLPEPCDECRRQCMMACECRAKSKLYTTPKCKRCIAKEFKKNTQKWVGGIAMNKNGTPIPIISGLVPPKICDCVEEYKYKILAVAARNYIQCHKATFVVGGVTITKDGPVYTLSTALRKRREIPKRKCKPSKGGGEAKPKLKSELGPYDCTCGAESSEEEEEEEEENEQEDLEEKTENENGYKDKDKKSACKKEKKKKAEEEIASDEDGDDDSDDSEKCTCKKPPKDFALTEPCDCYDVCECREATKLITESKCAKCLEKHRMNMVERIIGGVQKMGKHLVPIIQGTRFQDSCECLQDYKDKVVGIAAKNKIMNQKSKFVVLGISKTKEGPCYIVSTAMGKKSKKKKRRKDAELEECACKKSKKKKSTEEEPDDSPFKYSCCRCKEELERFLSHKCTCKECMDIENSRNATYIKGGIKYTESGNVINVLSGVYGQSCNCLEKYLEKIAALEDYRKRIEARYHLKSQNVKYAVGGVVNTPKGPVYIISGMRPPVECECARVLQQKLEEQEQQARMPKMTPTGRIKYGISGVKQMSQENVFVVSQAMAVDDCNCMKLYNKFEEAHKSCLDTYEKFLKQIQQAIDEYNNDLTGGQFGEYIQSSSFEELDDGAAGETIAEPTEVDTSSVGKTMSSSESEESSEYTESESESSDTWMSTTSVPAMELKFTPSGRIDTSLPGEEKEYNEKEKGKEKEKKKEVLDENQDLKRFIILKEIPCKRYQQVVILKKILKTMEEDGYPLAKLPDCYKLPHFKLWMKMRCGFFWAQKDRRRYEMFSKIHWCHTDKCHRDVRRPQLGIDKEKASLMTWRDSAFIKRIVSEKVGMFYRLVRQENTETVREFFPLTFSYEFPTPAFRDCFFAYLGTKEENVLVYRITKPHEARVNLKKFPCYP